MLRKLNHTGPSNSVAPDPRPLQTRRPEFRASGPPDGVPGVTSERSGA